MSTTPAPGPDETPGEQANLHDHDASVQLLPWDDAHVRFMTKDGLLYLHLMVQLPGRGIILVPLPWEMGVERLQHEPAAAFRVMLTGIPEQPYAFQWLPAPPPLDALLALDQGSPPRLPQGSGSTKPQEPLSGRTPLPAYMWQSEHLMRQVGEL